MITFALLLAAADPMADCAGTPAEATCRERMKAHDAGDFDLMEDLIAQEVEILGKARASTHHTTVVGSLRTLCHPLEAGFNVCNERQPGRGCAEKYLLAYTTEGCLEDPAQRPRHQNMLAMYWHRRMDDGKALEHLQRAESWAWALWLAHWDEPVGTRALVGVVVSTSLRAEIAASLRNADALQGSVAAIEQLRGRLAAPEFASVVADTINGLAWSLLLAHEAEVTVEDPTPLLAAALRVFTHRRPDRAKADNVRINLALAALHRDDFPAVQRWGDEIAVDSLEDEGRMWLRIVQIRAALAQGAVRSTAQWQTELDAIAARHQVPMAPWFAAWARGLRMERLGRADAAIMAYEAAEAALEAFAHTRRGAQLPTLADRLFLSFADPTRRLVRLLVAAGDVEQAVRVVRNARSRALRVAARDTCAEAALLRDGRPGAEVLRLIYFRVSPRDHATDMTQWAAIAVTRHSTRIELIELGPIPTDLHGASEMALQRWSDALLEPFADEITAAAEIEILATDVLHAVPFPALPWDGAILLDHAPVYAGLDLANCGEEMDTLTGPILVVSGDDPRLIDEANAVVAVLRTHARSAELLLPRTPDALKPLLNGPYSMAHLAAHGTRPGDSEMFASDDRLLFTEKLMLTRQTILAATRAPALVLLTACQASFTDRETLAGGVGLADAFLLRGSRFVIGPVHEINGTVAQAFATRFYKELADGELADVPSAWRAAYLSTRAVIAPSLEPDLRMLRLHTR